MTATLPRPVLLDCDPGTDDALALWLALAAPEIDLRLVTVAGGNVGLARTLPNALALVGLAGGRVPVVAGADRPLLGRFRDEAAVHGADGLGGVVLPPGPAATPGLAMDAIRAALRAAAPDSVTLVGLGPATNFALALAAEPALRDRVAEIVLMTGALGEGNWSAAAEFNAAMDPEALAILLACGRPVTLATLDLTAQAFVTPARIEALRAAPGGACLRAAADILASVPPSRRFGFRGVALHDPCAVAWLLAPALFTARAVAVAVVLDGPDRGRTRIDRWGRDQGAALNGRFLETLDAEGFFALLAARLGALP
ncbi:nucleoside hydrolase [Roseomonas sp. USHLN139]|uniref:nucleoside hydrolase n=1 Tax=Roseomonas sp. USHLN139 TaxID=3081298 RepID=UPI003B01CBFF